MAEYLIQDTTLTAIADAVRAKKGTTEPIALTDLATEIESIQSGGGSDSNKLALVVGKQSADNLYEITKEDLYGITEIRSESFYSCSGLTSIAIPDSVTSIGESALAGCNSLTSVAFGEKTQLTTIGSYAFANCRNLTSITIPDSVTSIDMSAFRNCTSLTNVTIGSGVTSIGSYAFADNTRLKNITMKTKNPPTITSTTFHYIVQTYTVPVGCGEAYRTANVWANYAGKIVEATE